jgi:hypothetical protein
VFVPDKKVNKNVEIIIADIASFGAPVVDMRYNVTKFEITPIAVVAAKSLLKEPANIALVFLSKAAFSISISPLYYIIIKNLYSVHL